jgi:uncharacterized protein (TIGR02246 family)
MKRSLMIASALAAALAASACATTSTGSPMAAAPTLADREAIEATIYRYARGLDRRDPDLYASAWSEDAVFDLGGGRVFEGRDAIRAIVTGLVETAEQVAERGDPPRRTFHMDANPRLEFLGPDHAIYHAYYFTYVRVGEGQGSTTTLAGVGSTQDELKKVDGEWLIVKRTVSPDP